MTQENPADRRPVDDVLADMDDILDNWHGSEDAMRWNPDWADGDGPADHYHPGGLVTSPSGALPWFPTWVYTGLNQAMGAESDGSPDWSRGVSFFPWNDGTPYPDAAQSLRDSFQRTMDRLREQMMGRVQEETAQLQAIAYSLYDRASNQDTPSAGWATGGLVAAPESGEDSVRFIDWFHDHWSELSSPTVDPSRPRTSRYSDNRPRHESPYGPRRRGRR